MPEKDLLYRLALSRIAGIGPVCAKNLLNRFGDAEAIFKAKPADLSKVASIGAARAKAITGFDTFTVLEKELAFIEKYAIRCLFITDKDYPQRLLCCKDAPTLLFYKGNADLNVRPILSVVGTRAPTEYGKQVVDRLIRELAACGPLILSGLAYGIDAAAHAAALRYSLPTVAVLGHGLDQLYPPENKPLAARIIKQGGLLTNFNIEMETSSHNFPLRNRIVAGMCDALVVVETDTDGGSMLTVNNALSYKKKVFTFPGRLTDKKSRGCNQLVQEGKARLLLHASQLISEMGWGAPSKPVPVAKTLFESTIVAGLADDHKKILHLLGEKTKSSIDELSAQMNLNSSVIAMSLLTLEMQGLILSLPGKMYRLAL
ncbi:MAG TPA: DNA-processing protein DprA [Puia sp.]|jgi:DNA processing protein|nr:DNA-processing protein DprA [Puia sp.]